MNEIHISIAAEPITRLRLGDFSLVMTNSMISFLLICVVLCGTGIVLGLRIKSSGKTGKAQAFIEMLYQTIEGIVTDNLGSKEKARPYIGLAITMSAVIAVGSWFGLIPGVLHVVSRAGTEEYPIFRAPTTDLNFTLALSVIAWLVIQFAGVRALGLFGYIGKFINFSHGPMNTAVGFLELISEVSRLVSFSFRLFGNIFAGEVLIIVLIALTRMHESFIGVPIPALVVLMETFVALIQAYVFVSLMSVFISTATEPAHH
jgi:F-type H+-transporting ATPase subunit a